jgi:predicted TIM-barrel fold metal-dependent hydrolase
MKPSAREITDCHFHPAVDADTDMGWFYRSGDAAAQVAALRRAGIARACGAPVRALAPAGFAPIRAMNDGALRLRDRFPGFYIPGIQIHPRFPDESCAEIARCCGREGVRWVGELVGYMMGFGEEYASPAALAVFREAARHGAAVNLHCDDLAVVESLCTALPALNVVLAHPGAGRREIEPRVALVARLPNLHLDLSGSGIDRLGIVRQAVEQAGAHKILFGSDFPINNPAVYVHGVLFEELPESVLTAVFGGNFQRLTAAAF